MKNLTNVHKKLDRLIAKMGAVDETQTLVRQLAETNRYLPRRTPGPGFRRGWSCTPNTAVWRSPADCT
jgi:hypothetical protein